ncbi:MAG: 16S rRNA (guanine(527)-N(7))-methyltransferase RsmG [Chloroflexi bacterium]|nr:16S rRNA (guanine(527)-N(7))-methyltransferase RsmG [Chloroflexota bacterium]
MLSLLTDGVQELGLTLTKQQVERFETYYEMLTEWSERISLTAIRDLEGVQKRHFLESASIIPVLADQGLTLRDRSLIDVGSGTGVPGIPLKILEPSLRLTLVEAKRRKAQFLEAVLPVLGLSDVTVVTQRAEQAARDPDHRDQYDFAIAKALAPMRTLAELMLPFVTMGGVAIAPKGSDAENEVKEAHLAIETLKGSVRAVAPLPLSDPAQQVILVDKDLPTPLRYPRRPGVPAKRPL